jgi:hypothetical protein
VSTHKNPHSASRVDRDGERDAGVLSIRICGVLGSAGRVELTISGQLLKMIQTAVKPIDVTSREFSTTRNSISSAFETCRSILPSLGQQPS